jgi:membrane fusion protein (multidrug efflux system)
LAAPEIALLDEGAAVYVYKIVAKGPGSSVEKVKITAGRRMQGKVEILGGLTEGDTIIVNGVSRVRPGQPVRVNAPGVSGANAGGGASSRGKI